MLRNWFNRNAETRKQKKRIKRHRKYVNKPSTMRCTNLRYRTVKEAVTRKMQRKQEFPVVLLRRYGERTAHLVNVTRDSWEHWVYIFIRTCVFCFGRCVEICLLCIHGRIMFYLIQQNCWLTVLIDNAVMFTSLFLWISATWHLWERL